MASIETINAEVPTGYIFQYVSSLTADEIDWISKGDLYSIIVKQKIGDNKEKTELLRKLNGHLAYLNTIKPDFVELKAEFMELHKGYEKEWATNMKALGRVKDKLIANFQRTVAGLKANEPRTKEVTDKFVDSVTNLTIAWSQTPNYLVQSVAVQNLIEPLIYICSQNITRPEALEFINYATECRDAHKNLEVLKAFYVVRLQSRREGLLGTKTALDEICRKVSEMKDVPV